MSQPAKSTKDRVEKEVLEVIIKNLYSGEMKVEEARQVARETLAQIEKIEKQEESISDFYKNLSQKYPVFKVLYTKIKGELAVPRELSAHRQALVAIHAGNIDEAHKIAQGALVQTAHETTDNKQRS